MAAATSVDLPAGYYTASLHLVDELHCDEEHDPFGIIAMFDRFLPKVEYNCRTPLEEPVKYVLTPVGAWFEVGFDTLSVNPETQTTTQKIQRWVECAAPPTP